MAAIDEHLHAVDINPVGALDAHMEFHLVVEAGISAGDRTILCAHFKKRAGGQDHPSGLGVAADLPPVNLRGNISVAFNIGAPATDAVAIDRVRVAYRNGMVAMAAVEQLQPDELPVLAHVFAPAPLLDAVGHTGQNLTGAIILCFQPIDQVFKSCVAAVRPPVCIAVDEFLDHIRMVDVQPAVSARPAPITKGDGIEPRVVLVRRRTVILNKSFLCQRETVEVRARACAG